MEKRCKTISLLLLLSVILQGMYVLAEAVILIAQRPLKMLWSAGTYHEAFEQNLYPLADILGVAVVLVLHVGLVILIWSQMGNVSFQVAEI